MKKPKYYSFHLFAKYTLEVFGSKKQWNRAMKISGYNEHIISNNDNIIGRAGYFLLDNGLSFGMYIDKKDFQYKIVIHESTHIVDYLMDQVGINDMEFRALMIEDLSYRIIEYFRNLK